MHFLSRVYPSASQFGLVAGAGSPDASTQLIPVYQTGISFPFSAGCGRGKLDTLVLFLP